MRSITILVLLLGSACSSSPSRGSPDLASPDLVGSDYCSGTVVAGTCAQAFFARAAACVDPSSPCVGEDHLPAGQGFCFASGGHLSILAGGGDAGAALLRGIWTAADGQVCMTSEVPGPSQYRMTLHQGDQTLTYDLRTGDLVCPDGSSGNIGRVDTCGELHQLLDPNTCLAGSCPL